MNTIWYYPPPPPFGGCPHVALESATLRGHRMTSSHSSKDPLRPPVSGGQSVTTAKRKSPLAQNTTSADTYHHWGSLRIVLSLKSHLCHRWPITFIVKHIHQSSSPFSCIFCIYSIPLYAKISKTDKFKTSSRLLHLFAVYLYIPPHDKEASITDI